MSLSITMPFTSFASSNLPPTFPSTCRGMTLLLLGSQSTLDPVFFGMTEVALLLWATERRLQKEGESNHCTDNGKANLDEIQIDIFTLQVSHR